MPPQSIDILSDIVANNLEFRNIAVSVIDNSHLVQPDGKLVRTQPSEEVPAGPPDGASLTIMERAKLEGGTIRNIAYTVVDNSLKQIPVVTERSKEAEGEESNQLSNTVGTKLPQQGNSDAPQFLKPYPNQYAAAQQTLRDIGTSKMSCKKDQNVPRRLGSSEEAASPSDSTPRCATS